MQRQMSETANHSKEPPCDELTTKRTIHSQADLGRTGLSWVGSVLHWAGMSRDEASEDGWTSLGWTGLE